MAKEVSLNMYKGILSNKVLGYGARIVLCAIKSNTLPDGSNTLEIDDISPIVGESANSIKSHLYRLRKEGVYLVNNLDQKLPLNKDAIIPTDLLLAEMDSWTEPCYHCANPGLIQKILNWLAK